MADTSSFSAEDDHEIWCLLSSGNSADAASMKGLDQRWIKDQASVESISFWQHLIKTAQSLGFSVQLTTTPSPVGPVAGTSPALPAAFETTSGKDHVDSLSKLLNTDANEVVQLTLGALHDVNTKDQHLQSLLGTRSLFLRALDYHGKQRSARVGIVTELLRASNEDSGSTSSMLSTLDKQSIVNGKDERGLLQTLLCAASAPDAPPTRDQVLPLKKLGDEFFVQKVLQVLAAQRLLEREQAMEALLALLYSRLQVSCCDLILILLALQSSGEFFTTIVGSNETRLPQLAGLLCAEAVNLNTAGPNHSLLESRHELKLLKNVVMNFSEQVFLRREKCSKDTNALVPAPESIIMLAIGLLLKLTGNDDSVECVELANTCGAFEYLQATFDTILPERSTFQLGDYQDTPLYDWQFSDSVPTLAIEQDDDQPSDMSPNVVIYTSIGLELLRSIVMALHDFLGAAPDNLTALCRLGATLYANQPMLCDEFWNQPGAVGTLLEAAFGKSPASWELLAAVCSNRESVQRVMDMVSEEYLVESLSTNAEVALPAIAKMAQLDPTAIREALNNDSGVLFRILSFYPSNENVLEHIFNVMSWLIRGCPSWAITCVTFFGARSSNGLLARCFSAGKPSTVAAAARVLDSLVEGMVVACFTNTYPEHQVLEYLSVTVKASLAACSSLSGIFAFSSEPSVSYFNAYLILKASSEILTLSRQLRRLHTAIKVREAASEARDEMLEAFATSTSFGQALAYFAGAPVSLSIALLIEETLHEANLLQLATEEYAVDESSNPMGKWRAVLQKATEPSIEQLARERLSNLKKVRIDMAAVRSRGWSDSESSPVHAAAAAIKLLKTWAMEAEDVLLTQLVENKNEFLSNTSPYRLLHASATMPPIVKATPKLAYFWPACALSTSDILVHIVASKEVSERSLPFHESLALLSLSAAHAKYCGGFVGNTYKTTSPLLTCMKESIEKAIENESKEDVQNGILFVKLLGYVLNVDFPLGLSLLEHDDSAIGSALARSIKTMLKNEVPALDRLGAESLRVIRLAKKSDDILEELSGLATISRKSSLVRNELVAQSLEILAESELAGKSTGSIKDLLGDQKFHEEALIQFRECVISMCKAMSKFRPIGIQLKLCVTLGSPSLFAESFPTGDSRALLDMMSLNQYDMKAASTMLYSLNKEEGHAGEISSATENLLICMISVKKQVGTVAAWTKFLQVSASNSDKLIPSHIIKTIEIFLVNNMHELAKLKGEVEQEVPSLSNEIEAIFDVVSTLLLDLTSLGSSGSSLDHIKLQHVLEAIEVIAPKAGASPTKEVSTSLNNLLAVAAIVLQKSPSTVDLTRFVHIVRQAMFIREDVEIFRTALALLAAILHNETLVADRGTRAKIATAMLEDGLVNVLVDEVSAASARAVKDTKSFDGEEVTTVQSLITVLLGISNAGEGEASFGALFLRSNLSKMLLSNPLFAQAIPRWAASGSDSHYRGYMKDSSKRANEGGMARVTVTLSGQNDHVHKVWRLAIRLVTSLLRVSARHGRHRDFQKLALEFSQEYGGVIRSCLAKCSMVGQNAVLTHNLVDEADEILALLSELSTKSEGFLDLAVSVVGSLGKFLGAIGTSRFLFKLAQDVEAASQEQDSPFGNLQALHPALSGGGANNARYEAIRYAHFARSAYAMVTSDDHKQFSKERGTAPSGSDLENTCYRAINNSFCREIEVAVAYCLTNALTLLSKTHPASRSFVLFSSEESRRLNPFTIVRNGAIIAVHADDSLKFARVLSADTVRRSWKCTIVEPQSREAADEEVTVSVKDLAGVEDILKRKVLFQYLPAPDAATELENVEHSKTTNIGHLILTLRWCREGENGIDATVRTDLAESASALLATELALHREIGTDKLAKDAVAKNVNDQIFDLLDGESKFPGLTDCIGPEFLQQIRGQLQGMLDLARKERQEKRAKYEARLAAMNASNPFWR